MANNPFFNLHLDSPLTEVSEPNYSDPHRHHSVPTGAFPYMAYPDFYSHSALQLRASSSDDPNEKFGDAYKDILSRSPQTNQESTPVPKHSYSRRLMQTPVSPLHHSNFHSHHPNFPSFHPPPHQLHPQMFPHNPYHNPYNSWGVPPLPYPLYPPYHHPQQMPYGQEPIFHSTPAREHITGSVKNPFASPETTTSLPSAEPKGPEPFVEILRLDVQPCKVTLDLAKENWSLFYRAVQDSLGTRGAWGYLTGDDPCPDVQFPNLVSRWTSNDSKVLLWLRGSVSVSKRVYIKSAPSSAQAWSILESRHLHRGGWTTTKLMRAVFELQYDKKNSYSWPLLSEKIRDFRNRIFAGGSISPDDFLKFTIINASRTVPEIQSRLLAQQDMSLSGVLAVLDGEHELRVEQGTAGNPNHAASVVDAGMPPNSALVTGPTNRAVCTNASCRKKAGHSIRYCVAPGGGMAGKTVREAIDAQKAARAASRGNALVGTLDASPSLVPPTPSNPHTPLPVTNVASANHFAALSVDQLDDDDWADPDSTDDSRPLPAALPSNDPWACVATTQMPFSYQSLTGEGSCIVSGSDGSHIASGSDDCSVRVWDVQTGEQINKLGGHCPYPWACVAAGVSDAGPFANVDWARHSSALSAVSSPSQPFVVDLGATVHISPFRSDFSDFRPIPRTPINGIGDTCVYATGIGTTSLSTTGGPLILEELLKTHGCDITFNEHGFSITSSGKVLGQGYRNAASNLFELSGDPHKDYAHGTGDLAMSLSVL